MEAVVRFYALDKRSDEAGIWRQRPVRRRIPAIFSTKYGCCYLLPPILLDRVRSVSTCFFCAGFIPAVRIDTIRSVS